MNTRCPTARLSKRRLPVVASPPAPAPATARVGALALALAFALATEGDALDALDVIDALGNAIAFALAMLEAGAAEGIDESAGGVTGTATLGRKLGVGDAVALEGERTTGRRNSHTKPAAPIAAAKRKRPSASVLSEARSLWRLLSPA